MTLYSRYLCLPDWCNPDEAASFLGVSKCRVYKMLEDGCFPHSWRSHPVVTGVSPKKTSPA